MVDKALVLGYGPEKSPLVYESLENHGLKVHHEEKPVVDLSPYSIVVSFGYRHLITRTVLESAETVVLNLHTSLLPHNRGAHPIFWAAALGNPFGVSLHQIDEGVDTGPVFAREQIDLTIDTMNFREAHNLLLSEAELLLEKSIDKVLEGQSQATPQAFLLPAKKAQDLPREFAGWDALIGPEIRRLKLSGVI